MFICDIMVFWITIFFGSSVKWIDISHKLYKKKLVLCIFVVIKLQEHGYQHNAKPLRRLPTRPQNSRYEDNNLVLEIQTPRKNFVVPYVEVIILRNGNDIFDYAHRYRLENALSLKRPLMIAYYLKEDLKEIWNQCSKQKS